MLLRMYLRYCERKGYRTEVLEESAGRSRRHQERVDQGRAATTRTATCAPRPACTGWCARARSTPTRGATRRSPACSSTRRSTTRSRSTSIRPTCASTRYRASGAGGQHINKTDSAVRITHLPTNIVVQCQNDRSQHRNRAEAMAMLKSKLYELELRKRQDEQQKLEDSKTDIGWGHQIRSYVLDQSRIKDLRTNVEVGNTQARARRRPRRVHRREPEAGRVTMSDNDNNGTAPAAAPAAAGREPDHRRAPRQARGAARAAGSAFPNDFRRDALGGRPARGARRARPTRSSSRRRSRSRSPAG